tara:strand:- start:1758 stop:2864 length:1107 start_codon:yes stop_codon:yes gene_type:complete
MNRYFLFFLIFFSSFIVHSQCEDVTVESITNPGPYSVSTLVEGVDGIRNGPDYDGATIYYPVNASPPYAGIAIVPGYCGEETNIQEWGFFYASHGIVAITIGTNDPCADWPSARATALLDAIVTVKEENARVNSPLQGSIDVNRFAVSGWSMGGGGAQLAASIDPSLRAVIGLCPWLDLNGFQSSDLIHNVPVLIFTGQNDDIANPTEYGFMHYQGTPSGTDKLYFEITNGGHGAANSPNMANGEAGVYALSWLKTYLLNEPCYCDFLLINPSNSSAYETNVECDELSGIEEGHSDALLLFPNPSASDVMVSSISGLERSFSIFNDSGQLIREGILPANSNKIELEYLDSGSYLLSLEGELFRFSKLK